MDNHEQSADAGTDRPVRGACRPAAIESTQRLWAELEVQPPGAVQGFDLGTIADLPDPARRFLTAAIPDQTPLATAVEVEMTGRIKLGIWLPFTARQILRAGIGFVWEPSIGRRLLRFVGADTLGSDGARMQFRLHDRIPVVNASGHDTDRSAAGRLAAETVAWLPQALTPQAGAQWRSIDDKRAIVVLAGPSGPVEIEITVDDDGRLMDIELQRWNASAEPPRDEAFGATATSSGEFGGVLISDAGTVGWGHRTPADDRAAFFDFRITAARFS